MSSGHDPIGKHHHEPAKPRGNRCATTTGQRRTEVRTVPPASETAPSTFPATVATRPQSRYRQCHRRGSPFRQNVTVMLMPDVAVIPKRGGEVDNPVRPHDCPNRPNNAIGSVAMVERRDPYKLSTAQYAANRTRRQRRTPSNEFSTRRSGHDRSMVVRNFMIGSSEDLKTGGS